MPDPQVPEEQITLVANALAVQGWRRRRGKDSRPKLRGTCLFHQDPQPSADFYTDDGWYYCHGCAESYAIEEVAEALSLPLPQPKIKMDRSRSIGPLASADAKSEFHYHSRLGWPQAIYTYRFPDGRISHYKLRFAQPDQRKTFFIQAPDKSWSRPIPYWPIYGDRLLPSHLNMVVVEGEKAQQRTSAAAHIHQGILISALTMGSAVDMKDSRNRSTLVDRIQALNPNRILVWPDNDKPGQEWALPLHRQLLAMGLPTALVDTRALPIEHGEGCDDFIDAGGSLDAVFEKEFQQVGGSTVDEIIQKTVVTKSDQFLLLGTRRLLAIKRDHVEVLHFRATGQPTPSPKIIQRLRVELASKSSDSGVDVYYRRWHDKSRTQLAWRGLDSGYAYHISAQGQNIIQDPPHSLLLLPSAEAHFPVRVDESGQRVHLEAFCRLFGLAATDTTFVEGWLLCALLGLQTPILLLRGEAGSGKTTLARALVGIVEPTVPSINLRNTQGGRQGDERALIEGLRQSVAVLLDNVSSLSGEAEDLLSQFVTGFSVVHRQLYENKVENLSMQRAIIITTTNYNVNKGDLSSRLIAIRMLSRDGYQDEDQINAKVQPLVEKIRGYLFKTAVLYYQNASPNGHSSLRIAGISKVFRSLGYDSPALEAVLAHNRGSIASEGDSWFNAVVDWYRQLNLRAGQVERVKLEEIKGAIEGLTDQFLPTNNRFAAFLNEAAPRFRDFGFVVEKHRMRAGSFWDVKCFHELLEEDDDEG